MAAGFFASLALIRKVVRNDEGQYAVTDSGGSIIVPFGQYAWISSFHHGLARVKTGSRYMGLRIFDSDDINEHKWGIIDSTGKEVVPAKYDEIWRFDHVYKRVTKAKLNGQDCVIDLCGLSQEYDRYLRLHWPISTPSKAEIIQMRLNDQAVESITNDIGMFITLVDERLSLSPGSPLERSFDDKLSVLYNRISRELATNNIEVLMAVSEDALNFRETAEWFFSEKKDSG